MAAAADRDCLLLRTELMRRVREFFARHPALEVQTPVLNAHTTTAPGLNSIEAQGGWLRTSPEHQMKALLAAGIGDIWQLGPCFRADESGRVHNTEFQMLEWYRVGAGLDQILEETCRLVDGLLADAKSSAKGSDAWQVFDYREFFLHSWRMDPFTAEVAELRELALSLGAPDFDTKSAGDWCDYLMEQAIRSDHAIGRLVVQRFPADQAELAVRAQEDGREVARRFEIWVDGLELANGAEELTDGTEAARRMEDDNLTREERGLPAVLPDLQLLHSMQRGLPACAGVALGFDRVVMLAAGAESLAGVLPAPYGLTHP